MTLDALIMFAGAFIAILPYLGLPNSWDSVLMVIVGIFIIALGIVVRRRGHAGNSSADSMLVDSVRHEESQNQMAV